MGKKTNYPWIVHSYDTNGCLIKISQYDHMDSLVPIYTFLYNNGKLEQKLVHERGNPTLICNYEYNTNNKPISSKCYTTYGNKFIGVTKWKYRNKKLIEKVDSGKVIANNSITYKYSYKGRQQQIEKIYDIKDVLLKKSIVKMRNGKIILRTNYTADGKIKDIQRFYYDRDDMLNKLITMGIDGRILEKRTFTYTYF